MIFKRLYTVNELPFNCFECPISPNKMINKCNRPLDNEGHWINNYCGMRHEQCPLIELTMDDILFLLNEAKKNRENSAALEEIPEQRWKQAHKSEVKKMNKLISNLEIVKNVLENSEV